MCTFNYFRFSFFILMLSIVSFAPQANEQKLTIQQAVDLALSQNYLLAAEQARVDAAQLTALGAERSHWPKITAYSTISRTNSPLQAFGSKLEQSRISASDFDPNNLNNPDAITNFQTRLEIAAPIYNGGAITAGRQRAAAFANSSIAAKQGLEQQIIFEVIKAYGETLQAEAQISATQKAYQAAKNHQKTTQALLEKGMVIPSDLMDADVHLLDVNIALTQSKHARARAEDQLRDLLGMDFEAQFSLEPFELEVLFDKSDVADWVQWASVHRSDLKVLQEQMKASQSTVVERRSAFKPQVAVKAVQSWNSDSMAIENGNTTLVGVVEWNLFSGGSDKAALDVATAQTSQLRYRLQDKQQQIRREVMEASRQLSEAKYRREAWQKALSQAEEALRIRTLRHDQGLENTTDLLNSQAQADSVRAEYIRAGFDVTLAQAALFMAAGKLTSEVVQ
ncbi:MAG: TolC family protein [Gammaproteobacteria bacterium]|nr:TolC family protein [Gammaproteobacteria bacterium]